MIKRGEWATVAYLSQSKYGKYGNSNFNQNNKEIYMIDRTNSALTLKIYLNPQFRNILEKNKQLTMVYDMKNNRLYLYEKGILNGKE